MPWLDDPGFYDDVLLTWLILAVLSFVALQFISAPYGRHERSGWGPTVPNRIGWIVMESPTLLVFGWLWATGQYASAPAGLALAAIWYVHYVNRTLVYPFRIRQKPGQRMPVVVAAMAFLFQLGNTYLQAAWIFRLSDRYGADWLMDPRFIGGLVLFGAGFFINLQSDSILRNLRKPGETGYKIPRGGMYEYVSCPNYLGEIVEWTGWALATWSPGGLLFAIWTVANLAPRAATNHAWYRETFDDYPKARRRVIPFIW